MKVNAVHRGYSPAISRLCLEHATSIKSFVQIRVARSRFDHKHFAIPATTNSKQYQQYKHTQSATHKQSESTSYKFESRQ